MSFSIPLNSPLFSSLVQPMSPEARFLMSMFIASRQPTVLPTSLLPTMFSQQSNAVLNSRQELPNSWRELPNSPQGLPNSPQELPNSSPIERPRNESVHKYMPMRDEDQKSDVIHLFPRILTNSPSTSNAHIKADPFTLISGSNEATREKPFKCSLCPRTFADNSNRRKHEQTHSAETPYECDFCDRRFKTKTYRSKHHKICRQKLGDHRKDSLQKSRQN